MTPRGPHGFVWPGALLAGDALTHVARRSSDSIILEIRSIGPAHTFDINIAAATGPSDSTARST